MPTGRVPRIRDKSACPTLIVEIGTALSFICLVGKERVKDFVFVIADVAYYI